MIVVHDHRGYGVQIDAVAAEGGRWNAVVKIRKHFPVESKPRVETVTCLKMTAPLAETSAAIRARRWIDLREEEATAPRR